MGLCYNLPVASDNPTEEALYGDLDVTREGKGPGGPFRIVFRPVGQTVAPSAGRVVEGIDALNAVLRGLGVSKDQIATLHGGLENSASSWIRVLAATVVLKSNALI
ncbi:MAG TPA: hypothetical protein VK335_03195 [Bryobacteraceae bacterium]|nr:hypothetical protein [Bryobacteraceae bacterium]